jgi:hypothetical protein
MQQAPHLLLDLEWWRVNEHFVRPHESLRQKLGQPLDRGGKRQPQRYRQRTPVMAAGLTTRGWTVRKVIGTWRPIGSVQPYGLIYEV